MFPILKSPNWEHFCKKQRNSETEEELNQKRNTSTASSMAKNKDDHSARPPPRPTITLPPRPSMEAFFAGGPTGLSPGPMTLVSSFFADAAVDSPSFSQLLAGAMASPIAMGFLGTGSTPNSESEFGLKQSKPMNLVVARSPLFSVPPGLSPSGLLNSPGFYPPQSPFGMSHQQALAQVTAQAALAHSHMHMQQAEYQHSSIPVSTEPLIRDPSFTLDEASLQLILPSTSDTKSLVPESTEVSHPDRKYQPPPPHAASDKPADDGYNWRKYGQKLVKGSEYPRSYYKCTHLNCPVKKKIERSPDGQITEIIYKGQHNHERPPANKRARDNSEPTGCTNSSTKLECGLQNQAGILNKSSENVQVGSSDSEEQGDTEITDDRDEDEPNPKRQNIEAGTSGVALSHKTLTEPKIIVQTRSEVDLLDDGYRWRKYGQKVVKGNPNPRSYYKCTSAGCNVRKHVERSSTDSKAVVTTYEGKHNHDVPAARNSSHHTVNNTVHQIKPHKVVAQKHPLLKELEFGSNEQRRAVLRLKEEKITV
ncbi:probable WRKY transcription factor 3 [Cucurbita moschata]|uniref:Probable WRKY transcription factor 3 n=1 Tax=Cucurbita moschata TaxID=3662 RepID=A0A6J1FKF4_CUCMO|nr:probable WRKY transcription factor 3 [Cucurbita moschata]